jgi:hypothetical protein
VRQRVFKYATKGYGIRILPRYLEALKHLEFSSTKDADEDQQVLRPGKGLDIHYKMAKARRFFDRYCLTYDKWRGPRTGSDNSSQTKTKLVLSHSDLDTAGQISAEPLRRSCLTGFELFYRHACLWEAAQAGQVEIHKDVWASTTV